jgi:hypothetical protein
MTVQAETAEGTNSSTELEPVAQGALALVQGDKPWNMLDLAAELAPPAAVFTEADALPLPAPKVAFSEVLRKALKALPDLFGQVMPDEVRKLDRHELKAVTDEAANLKIVAGEIKIRLEAIQDIIRNHQDKEAEESEDGLPPFTYRIAEGAAKGHWLLATPGNPYKTPVDGYVDSWRQQMVKGDVSVSPSVLFDLDKSGEVTREEFLAFTSAVRVYDADKAKVFIRKNPVRGLAILARMTRRSAPSASLVSPKK